jgi:4-amino-4-deoxy-L-arabinose transferase-like glycosyltransferase
MARRQKTAKRAKPPESWIHRHPRTVLAVLVATSIVARLTYFFQLDGTPFARMHEWRQTDMHYYDGWAKQIAGGDWKSTSVRVPMHRWHREVAERYLTQHPGAQPSLERAVVRPGARVDRDELLWSRWMRVPQFYQDPLYAYLIAVTYKLAPADARSILAWQLAIGVLSNVLIWLIARRVFGDTVAACAAGLAVLCAPLMFYEILLLRDSLIVFTTLALIWLLDRALTRGGWGWSAGLGLALGAACLLKGTFVLLAASLVLLLLLRASRRGRVEIVRLAGVIAGLAAALAPSMARNAAVGVSPLALASSGPLTFVASNHVLARPEMGFGIDTNELARFLGATDGGWRSAIVDSLGTHTFASYASLLWRKWDRLWHWFEIPNNEDFYYMRLKAPVLAWLPVTFWLCSPLALVGLVLGARRWREAWPLYLLAAVTAAPLILFYVLGRFRIPFLSAVIPFAALTLVEAGRALGARRYGRGLAIAAAVLVVAAWTGRPLAADQRLIRTSDWILPWSVTYESQVYGALDAKDPARAAAAYLEFFNYEPTDAQIIAARDPQLAPELADMHRECAQILRLAGQPAQADAQLQRARHLLELRTSH